MVAPLVAAAGRVAAKAASKAKSAAKAKTAARARKVGDESTNARKRYYRASERYLKKAEESSGATSKRYRQLAKRNFEDALNTYEPGNTQKYSKPIQRLANEFGVDLESRRQTPLDKAELSKRKTRQKFAIAESKNVTETSLRDDDFRREREAQTLFRSSEIGRRILGGYVDVWKDEASYIDPKTGKRKVDSSKIFKSLYKYFNVDNLADLVEKVEAEIGDTLYDMGDSDEIYEVVKLQIQNKVLDNDLYE